MSHSGRKYRETYRFELEWSRKEGQGEHRDLTEREEWRKGQGRVKKKKGRQAFSGRFPGCIRVEAEDQVRISQQILVNSDVSTGKKNLTK